MKVEFDCWYCKKHVEAEAIPIDPRTNETPKGFYSIETVCPHCGEDLETVIKGKE